MFAPVMTATFPRAAVARVATPTREAWAVVDDVDACTRECILTDASQSGGVTSSMTPTPTPSVTLSATLDAAERGLLDVAKTLVERALDDDGRRRDDKCVESALVLKKMRAECATVASALARARRDILGARSKTLDGGSAEKAALLERCSALEETCGKRAEEVERFARGEASTGTLDAPPTGVDARAGTTTTTTSMFGALKSAMQTLGLRGGETKERREEAGVASGVSTQRYSREQRAREANSGVQTRHGRGGGRDEGVRDENDRAGTRADDEYGSSNELGVRRGTWYAGAAESLARVGSKVIETVVERTPREELLGKRADVGASASAPSTSSTSISRVGMPKSTADRERSIRVDAMSASARLDASSETLSQCSEILANTEEIGASVLETLAAQRESLIRSGTAARSAQRNMDENLQTVKAMNSWTRLGAKPGWSR